MKRKIIYAIAIVAISITAFIGLSSFISEANNQPTHTHAQGKHCRYTVGCDCPGFSPIKNGKVYEESYCKHCKHHKSYHKQHMNKNIQSRRDFFKNAAKRILPILASITTIASIPVKTLAKPHFGCGWSCLYSCAGSCLNLCPMSCVNQCAIMCGNGCSGGCQDTCSQGCSSCVAQCRLGCGKGCSGTCIAQCSNYSEHSPN